jgi:hypothetical protein
MPPSGEVKTENDMTIDKKVARRKLSLLELASDLCNLRAGSSDQSKPGHPFYTALLGFLNGDAASARVRASSHVSGAKPSRGGVSRASRG